MAKGNELGKIGWFDLTVADAPAIRKTFENVAMSRRCGTLSRIVVPSARRAAAINGSAVFFDPLTDSVPRSGRRP